MMPFYLVLCASVALQRVSSGCITWTDNAVYVVRLKHRNRFGRTCDAYANTYTHMPLDERPCILCVVRARCISCTQRIYDAEIAYSIVIIIDEHWLRRRVGWTFIDSIFGLYTRWKVLEGILLWPQRHVQCTMMSSFIIIYKLQQHLRMVRYGMWLTLVLCWNTDFDPVIFFLFSAFAYFESIAGKREWKRYFIFVKLNDVRLQVPIRHRREEERRRRRRRERKFSVSFRFVRFCSCHAMPSICTEWLSNCLSYINCVHWLFISFSLSLLHFLSFGLLSLQWWNALSKWFNRKQTAQ